MALLGNLGGLELVLIAIVAVLVFGKNLPEAASKAYLQLRKLRNAVDDLRRESGIDRELRDIERSVREAEWEARKRDALAPPAAPQVPRTSPTPPSSSLPAAPPPSAPPLMPSNAPRADEPPAPSGPVAPSEPRPS